MKIEDNPNQMTMGNESMPEPNAINSMAGSDAPIIEEVSVSEEDQRTRQEKQEKIFSELVPFLVKKELEKANPITRVGTGLALAGPMMGERLFNFGADVINHTSRVFGGEDLVEQMDRISKFAPEDTLSTFTREGAMFMVGYSQTLKAINAVASPKGKFMVKGTEMMAGYMSELALQDPQQQTLLQQLIRKVPIGKEVSDYMSNPEDTNLEMRLKNSVFGLFEGEIAEGVFKALKHMKASRTQTEEFLKESVGNERGAVGGDGKPPKDARNEVTLRDDIDPLESDIPRADDTAVDDAIVDEIVYQADAPTGPVNAAEAGNGRIINLSSFDVEDDLRKFIGAIIERDPDYFARNVVTEDKLREIARKRNMTPEDLLAWEDEVGLKRGTILAAESLGLKLSQSLMKRALDYKRGAIDRKVFTEELETVRAVIRKISDMRSLAGSLLGEAGTMARMARSAKEMDFLDKLLGDDVDAIVDMAVQNDTTVAKMYDALSDFSGSLKDTLIKGRYASMLSDPSTHVRNIYGNAQNVALRPAETAVAATINLITRGKGVTFSDVYHQMGGLKEGVMDAVRIARLRMKHSNYQYQGVRQSSSKVPYFAKSPKIENNTNSILALMKTIYTAPVVGKALNEVDGMFKHINYNMTKNMEIHREAKKFIEQNPEATAKQVNDFIADLKVHTPEKIKAKSMADAEYHTLTNEVTEPLLRDIAEFGQSPLGRMLAPFMKVNMNAYSYRMERIPGFNFLLNKTQKDWAKGTAEERQMILAKMGTMSGISLMMNAIFHGEDRITGSLNSNYAKKALAEQAQISEGAIKFGNEWVEYDKRTPIGSILSIWTDALELKDGLSESEGKFIDEFLSASVIVLAEVMGPEAFIESMGEFGEAFDKQDPQMAKNAMKYSAQLASQFAPAAGLFRALNREFGGYIDEGGVKKDYRDVSSLLNESWNRVLGIYGMSAFKTKKRNILGYPIEYKRGLGHQFDNAVGDMLAFMGPAANLKSISENQNAVIKELVRLSDVTSVGRFGDVSVRRASGGTSVMRKEDFVFSMPPRTLAKSYMKGMINKVNRMSPTEYEEFVLKVANVKHEELKDGGFKVNHKESFDGSPTLEQALLSEIKSNRYKNSSDKFKFFILSKIKNKYVRKATKQMLSDFREAEPNWYKNLQKEIKDIYREQI